MFLVSNKKYNYLFYFYALYYSMSCRGNYIAQITSHQYFLSFRTVALRPSMKNVILVDTSK